MPQCTPRQPLDPQTTHSLVDDEVATLDAFRIIDEEMKRHGDFILSLKSRRNTFAPISKLPPELLSQIFGFVRDDDTDYYMGRSSWINVSYVCRTWRSVALNNPSLWTKLPLLHRRWTTEMLSRSKNASLTIDVEYFRLAHLYKGYERISSALTHASRIRRLILSNVDFVHMQNFLSEMPKQTPRLETLSLSIVRGMVEPSLESTICELPPELISKTHRLRRLELTRLKFDWDSILSESLTHFLVHDIPSSARPTRKQFWDALRKMPLLESINLVNTLPDPRTSHDDFRGGILHLPNLQSLTITSSTPEVEDFLQRISCLPTAKINIDCRGTAATLQDFTGLISWLSTTLLPLKRLRGFIRTLIIQAPSLGQGLRFQAFPEVYSNDDSMASLPAKLDLSLSFPFRPDQKPEEILEKMLADVSGVVSLQALVVLRLDQQGSIFSARTLSETFGSLPQLRSVNAVGRITGNLIKALDDTLPNKRSTRKQTQRPTFPALRSISIINANFEFDAGLTALEDMVKNRKNRGAAVRELNLKRCSRVLHEDLVALEKAVPKFNWDMVEMGFSDEEYYSDGYDFGGLYDSDTDYDHDDYTVYTIPSSATVSCFLFVPTIKYSSICF